MPLKQHDRDCIYIVWCQYVLKTKRRSVIHVMGLISVKSKWRSLCYWQG